jgi:hypothetical protein
LELFYRTIGQIVQINIERCQNMPLPAAPSYRRLDQGVVVADAATRPRRSRVAAADSLVLRGADVIRQQIRKQLAEDSRYAENAHRVQSELATKTTRPIVMACSVEEDDDFSDPWAGTNTNSDRSNRNMATCIPAVGPPLVRSTPLRAPAITIQFSSDDSSTCSFPTIDDTSEWADLSTILEDEEALPPCATPPSWGKTIDKSHRQQQQQQQQQHQQQQRFETKNTNTIHYDDDYAFVSNDYEGNAAATWKSTVPSDDFIYSSPTKNFFNDKGADGSFVQPEYPIQRQQQGNSRPHSISPVISEKTASTTKSDGGRDDSIISLLDDIPSPLSIDYTMLSQDPAWRHALGAGLLWQSLVSQLVKFPSAWWNGRRGPPLGGSRLPWRFCGTSRVRGHPDLNRNVANRGKKGRILLHVVLQDMMEGDAVLDIAIGVFHPNARGVRRSERPVPELESCRDVWLAVRKRVDVPSVVDRLLLQQHQGNNGVQVVNETKSPLAHRRVTNENIRAVFGDEPPLETIVLPETYLHERLSLKSNLLPVMVILEAFVFG